MVNDLTLYVHNCMYVHIGWASRENFMYISCAATTYDLEIKKNNLRLKIDRNILMNFRVWPKTR